MAMSATSPSTIMEAAFGRLHNSGAGAFGARPTVVESILVDGKAAVVATISTPTSYYLMSNTQYMSLIDTNRH